jgi:hypothetical protein
MLLGCHHSQHGLRVRNQKGGRVWGAKGGWQGWAVRAPLQPLSERRTQHSRRLYDLGSGTALTMPVPGMSLFLPVCLCYRVLPGVKCHGMCA